MYFQVLIFIINDFFKVKSVLPTFDFGEPDSRMLASGSKSGAPTSGIEEKFVIDHCHKNIARFKCPKSVSFRIEPMPVSGAGKILKTDLRKPYWKDTDKQVN